VSPAKQIVNPLAEENEAASNGSVVEYYQYDPAQSGNLINGNLVVFEDLTTPSTGPILIKKATTTPDFRMLGVVVDAPTGGYIPGSSVAVIVEGPTVALFDANNTVVNHLGICSSTTAGTLTDSSTATVGKTMCSIMEAVTIASGTALVPVYVHKM
jgi:hypothetical protein